MALQLWETLQQAITAYTGLTPATFFSVLAFGLAVYYLLTGMYGSTNPPPRPRSFDEDVQPLPPPVQLGEIGEDELKQYDGTDPKKPLLMAIKGQIYDVSQSSQEGDFGMNYELYLLEVASCGLLRLVSNMFYGPGGPYALFAGKDASRALAKMSFEDKDLTGDISGLGSFEMEALQDWEYKFMSKYVKVGTIKKEEVPVTDGSSSEQPAAEAADAKPAEATENGNADEDKPDVEHPVAHESKEE
ncbi:Membrane steroid-binding protein 2 [Linum perenne]